MSEVEIRPIRLPQDTMKFIKSWWPIYESDPLWVPPLISERKAFFNPKKNPYFKFADVQCFMAYRNGKVVGTIAATVDHSYQDTDRGMGLFGFFEFVNDQSVASALLDAAEVWLKDKGMDRMMGPFNLSSNHEFGLLVDGFDTPPCIANPHNHAYYKDIYEACGLKGNMDWYAYWLTNTGDTPKKISRVSSFIERRYPELSLRTVDLKNFDEEVKILHEIYNDAWEENWGHMHMSDEEFFHLVKGFKSIVDESLCWIAEIDGVPAALSITLPDYNQVAKKMNGRIFPFGWYHFLVGRKKIDALRIFILGVKKEFQHLPIGAPLYNATFKRGHEMGVRGAEASLILESNHRMRGALEKMGAEIYKTYRTYERKLG